MGEAGSFRYRIISLFAKRDWNQFSFGKFSRLLILFSFLNFSGLNNGLTVCVMTAGRIEVSTVTPGLIRQACQILTPSCWKRWTTSPSHLYNKPKKIIEISSQILLEKIFVEASSVREWAKSGVSGIVMSMKSGRGINPDFSLKSARSNSSALSANTVTTENIVPFIEECAQDRGIDLRSAVREIEEQAVILIQANASLPFSSEYVRYTRDEVWVKTKQFSIHGCGEFKSTGKMFFCRVEAGSEYSDKADIENRKIENYERRLKFKRIENSHLYSSGNNSDEDEQSISYEGFVRITKNRFDIKSERFFLACAFESEVWVS